MLKLNPLISIVTATHNRKKYLEECIRSVLCQTYENFEMIIVDDGSSDGTAELVGSFNNSKLHHIYQEKQGIWNLANTFNKALAHSRGEIVAILEDDDFWPPQKLEHLLPALSDPSVVFCWGKDIWVNSQGQYMHEGKNSFALFGDSRSKVPFVVNWTEMIRAFISRAGVLIIPSTVMIRRSALDAIGGFWQPSYFQSYDTPTLWKLVISGAGNYSYVPEVSLYYRKHPSNNSSKSTEPGYGHEAFSRLIFESFQATPALFEKDCSISANEIQTVCNRLTAMSEIQKGTWNLREKNWVAANTHFKNGYHPELPAERKIWWFLGMLSSRLHINLVDISMTFRKNFLGIWDSLFRKIAL